jgi:hypothetical protein
VTPGGVTSGLGADQSGIAVQARVTITAIKILIPLLRFRPQIQQQLGEKKTEQIRLINIFTVPLETTNKHS